MKFINVSECYGEPLEGVRELVEGKTLMSRGEQKFFMQFMKEDRPKKILEIGSNQGGTTAIILHAIEKLQLSAVLHSVDISNFEDTMRHTVDHSLGVVCPHWNQESWKIYCNTTVAGVVDEIGSDIDFCILDAAHSLPGEVLDLITILPYLKDGTIVVLHDIRLGSRGMRRNAIATNILFSTVVAEEKFLPLDDLGNIMNIAAFRITKTTRAHIHNLIQALSLPWAYSVSEAHWNLYTKVVRAHYADQYDFFLKSCTYGQKTGTSTVNNWDFEKQKQLLTKNGSVELDETNQNCVVFWGYGGEMQRILRNQAPWYIGGLLSENSAKQYLALRNRQYFVDAKLESPPNVHKPEFIKTLKETLVAVIITPVDESICNEIKKELLEMEILSEKIFFAKDFLLGEKETLNYPTGVL